VYIQNNSSYSGGLIGIESAAAAAAAATAEVVVIAEYGYTSEGFDSHADAVPTVFNQKLGKAAMNWKLSLILGKRIKPRCSIRACAQAIVIRMTRLYSCCWPKHSYARVA